MQISLMRQTLLIKAVLSLCVAIRRCAATTVLKPIPLSRIGGFGIFPQFAAAFLYHKGGVPAIGKNGTQKTSRVTRPCLFFDFLCRDMPNFAQ
jgi:hypothetical protein